MADNSISYNRFTTLPPNVADYGATVEELKLARGSPHKNPAVSPLPNPRLSQRRLALKPRGSDRLRLAEPQEPQVDPYEGPGSVLALSRDALGKLAGPVLSGVQEAVGRSTQVPPQVRDLMMESARRVSLLGDFLREQVQMAQGIQARAIAARRS